MNIINMADNGTTYNGKQELKHKGGMTDSAHEQFMTLHTLLYFHDVLTKYNAKKYLFSLLFNIIVLHISGTQLQHFINTWYPI